VTQELERRTAWGYRLLRCRPCRRTFNERTGTPFNHLQVPTDIALLVVLWRLRYKLSLCSAFESGVMHTFDDEGAGVA
jgi:putative transposase